MEANKVTLSHKLPSDGGMAKEEFIRVGTTLYKIVEQPRLNGGYVKKRIAWRKLTRLSRIIVGNQLEKVFV